MKPNKSWSDKFDESFKPYPTADKTFSDITDIKDFIRSELEEQKKKMLYKLEEIKDCRCNYGIHCMCGIDYHIKISNIIREIEEM